MKTDPNLNIQIKHTYHAPVLETQIQTEAKAPDVFSSFISEFTPFFEDKKLVCDKQFINQLTAHCLLCCEYFFALQDAMSKIFFDTKFKLTEIYKIYRVHYDCKAEAKPMALFYCLLLNPNLFTQSDSASKAYPIWFPLYRTEKILTNSNYIFRYVRANYTQCVHKIRNRDPARLHATVIKTGNF